MKTNWGKFIRDLMTEFAVSENGLAKRTEIDRSTIRRYLRNQSVPTIDKLERILDAFGYELEAIRVGSARSRSSTNPLTRKTPKTRRLIKPACMELEF